MGQAALHADGTAAQPRKAGGSSLITRFEATDSKQKVRKICCTTGERRYMQMELLLNPAKQEAAA